MRKFRRFWLVCCILVTLAFGAYRLYEYRTADPSFPEFAWEEDSVCISVEDGEEVLLEGVTASDAKDGDLTSSIVVEKLSNFYGDGRRLVTYVVFDSDGNSARLEREITYSDYHSPRFEMANSLRYATGEQIDLYDIVTVTDCLDGDLSNKVTIQLDTSINNRTVGTYQVEYSVTNSAGDTVYLPVELEVYQYKLGIAKMNLSDYLLYYEGEEMDYLSLLETLSIGSTELEFVDDRVVEGETEDPNAEEEIDADEEDTDGEDVNRDEEETPVTYVSYVTVQSTVDPQVPGVYPVYLIYNDGIYEGTEVVLVVVEE